ncbi:MAG TPA: disulfide bond formation protein B [Phenylobacterium sp.]
MALLSSALMLAIAHAFEAAGYEPCLLCLRQREVYWTAGGVALGGLVLLRFAKDRGWRVALDALLAVIFLVGLGVAVYHAGAEWKFWPGPTACAAGSGVSADAMADLLNSSKRIHAPSCEEPAWVFLGLSMAGWNALVSLKLTILSVAAAMLERNAR